MAQAKKTEITIPALDWRAIKVTIVGVTPLLVNKMSAKSRYTFLIGGRRKTAAERLEVKHDPFQEFKESMYLEDGFNEHTDIKFPCVAFKAAMATAALVTPGTKKTDVQRLIFIPSEYAPIYGVPRLRMDIVRTNDPARTPDVRTRAVIFPWATEFEMRYVEPSLNITSITTMLNNGGVVCGVGENRQEKGKGNFGTFTVADEVPPELLDIKAQRKGIEDMVPADEESRLLLDEYLAAIAKL